MACRCHPSASPLPTPSTALTLAAVTLASLLAASFLLLTYYLVLLRQHSSLRRLPPAPSSPPHPAWLVRTVGLDDSLIRSIPAVLFDSPLHLPCTICLADLSPGDLVRFLPHCRHPFHLLCVDTWLRSHITCPLCRSAVLPSPSADAGAPSLPPPINVGTTSSVGSGRAVIGGGSCPVMRSASMDECSRARKEGEDEEGGGGMAERSLSSSGGRFFGRFRSGSSSSVLPL